MCLAMPCREKDHFCNEACKEESMKASSSAEIPNPMDYEDDQLQEVQPLTTIERDNQPVVITTGNGFSGHLRGIQDG
jgi:hypothetical protein